MNVQIGHYITYRRNVGGLLHGPLHAKVIGGPNVFRHTSPFKATEYYVLWTVADEGGCTGVVDEADIIGLSSTSHNGYDTHGVPASFIKFCSECEEEDYFLVDDYICAPCRDARGYE